MDRIVAFCGIVCNECEACVATQANDAAAKERVAAHWRQEYNSPRIDAAYVTCDGCLAFDGRLGGHCLECDIRQCGVARGVANCAYCPDFGCDKLEGVLKYVPAARATLEEIRQSRTAL